MAGGKLTLAVRAPARRKQLVVRSKRRGRNKHNGTFVNLCPKPGMYGFPDKMRICMKYADNIVLDNLGAGASLQSKTYVANNIFDTELPIGGHQPMFRDNMSDIYFHYYVKSCAIKVTAIVKSSASQEPINVYINSTRNSNAGSVATTTQERTRNKSGMIAVGGRPLVLRSKHSTTEILGPFRQKTFSPVGTAPDDKWYHHVLATAVDPTAEFSAVLNIELIFEVDYYERKVQSQN